MRGDRKCRAPLRPFHGVLHCSFSEEGPSRLISSQETSTSSWTKTLPRSRPGRLWRRPDAPLAACCLTSTSWTRW